MWCTERDPRGAFSGFSLSTFGPGWVRFVSFPEPPAGHGWRAVYNRVPGVGVELMQTTAAEFLDGILAVVLTRQDDERRIRDYVDTITREVTRWASA